LIVFLSSICSSSHPSTMVSISSIQHADSHGSSEGSGHLCGGGQRQARHLVRVISRRARV
jgi:hypothetical protein